MARARLRLVAGDEEGARREWEQCAEADPDDQIKYRQAYMMAIGGHIAGGQVMANWPGLAQGQLKDGEDLETIAAFLQDAVVPMSEMAFLSDERRFAMVASRFRWEAAEGERVAGRIYERIRCGVRFDGVTSARVRDLDQRRRGDILSLLTVAVIVLLCPPRLGGRGTWMPPEPGRVCRRVRGGFRGGLGIGRFPTKAAPSGCP